ncbi:MAG: MFS transporter [Candidatus Rokubacteria bacterium]|nr:MFS transporter [Candidatus Rokubacteria bacterium]
MAAGSRRTVVAWTLYDFANSAFAAIIVTAIFPPYYTDLVVGNAEGLGDRWWGRLVSTSMVLVAVASPVLGGIADHAGARKPFLVGFTAAAVASTALLATVGPGMVVWGFVIGVAGFVTFEAAVVYYNAYLPRIASPERLGRVSAAGFAVGYAGSLVAFVAAYPFARAELYTACFLTTAVQFGVFAAPALLVLPGDARHPVPLGTAIARGFRETLATLREIVRHPERRQMLRFLLAYFVYEDGVNTVITMSGVFARTTLGFAFADLILLFLVVQITALLGSVAWARATDRRGPKLVVAVTLVQWLGVTTLAYFVTEKWQFWIVAVFAGSGLGAIQAASRTFMATLVPREREAEFFGFYSLVGKTGAILGPLLFGEVSHALAGDQRAAIFAVGSFFLIGLALLARVRAGGPTA